MTMNQKEPSNVKIRYVCMNSGNVFEKVDLLSFSGYEVKFQHNKISSIYERYGEHINTTIKFRPTMTPVIDSISCSDGYNQTRYSNNAISKEFYIDKTKTTTGEVIYFYPNQVLQNRVFYISERSESLNNEIIKYLQLDTNPGTLSWLTYNFSESERFNLVMKYGYNFKFHDEYKKDNSRFNYIADYCIKL